MYSFFSKKGTTVDWEVSLQLSSPGPGATVPTGEQPSWAKKGRRGIKRKNRLKREGGVAHFMNEGARMGEISASRAFSRRRGKKFPPLPLLLPTKQFETLQFPSLRSRGSFAFSVHTYFVQFRRRRKRAADVSGNFSRAFYFGWGGGGEIGFGGIFRIARGNLFGTSPPPPLSSGAPEMQKKIGDFSFLLL